MGCNSLISNAQIEDIYKDDNLISSNDVTHLCNADNSTINNLTLDRTTTRNNGILISSSTGVNITDSNISGCENWVRLESVSNNLFINNSIFNYSDDEGIWIDINGDDVLITNNVFNDPDSDGIDSRSDGGIFYNNNFTNFGVFGIQFFQYAENNLVYNNYFDDDTSSNQDYEGTNFFNTTKLKPTQEWQKKIENNKNQKARSLIVTESNEYIISGEAYKGTALEGPAKMGAIFSAVIFIVAIVVGRMVKIKKIEE